MELPKTKLLLLGVVVQNCFEMVLWCIFDSVANFDYDLFFIFTEVRGDTDFHGGNGIFPLFCFAP